jgi:hypothetical protein
MYDWMTPCMGNLERKKHFHATARARLRQLAAALRFPRGTYDVRSNMGGTAVSGEATLHHDTVYVQVCQSVMGPSRSILIRTCESRRDYTGGANHFAPIDLLDDIPALAQAVRKVLAANGGLTRL